MAQIETEVLIVGAGLTGATAALLLARHGIDVVMVSRSRWVADSPRAHIVNQRTMEVMRSVGLEDACRQVATPGELMANNVMLTAVAGREFGRMWTWGNTPARLGEYATASPTRTCDLPQDRFEPILVGEATRLGATARFGVEFVGIEQDDDGVTTTVRDLLTGADLTVRSRYVIGADGGQSRVADAIGLPLVGTPGIAPGLNVLFTADLSRHVAHRPGSLYWILQPERPGRLGNAILRMVRPWHEWIVTLSHLGESAGDLSDEAIARQVAELVQDESIEIRIKDVHPWRINHVIAERYGEGRVFCAGDAVHRHPPMNALGGNTCIQDAFNLAWKLAAVLRRNAGPALLDSYTAERRPVGKQVVDRAIASWRQNPEMIDALGIDPQAAPEVRRAQFEELFADTPAGELRRETFERAKRDKNYSYNAHGVEMNQVYSSDVIVAGDEPPLVHTRDPELHFQASSRPGARLPHCWVEHRGKTCSTLDLARPERFTLLARTRGGEWLAAAAQIADELGLDLTALRIGPGREVADLYGEWATISEIGETGCLLVRPDQHIAWRCRTLPDDPVGALRAAVSRSLALADSTIAGRSR